MTHFIHIRGLAAAAVAITAALTGAGAAAAHGKAAGHVHRAKLRDHRLVILGTEANDKIALRLKAGRPDVLQVDVGDDGSADFSVHLEPVDAITVDARAGDDTVRIDDGNGTFTDSIPTTIAGGDGNDTVLGGAGRELLLGGDGNDAIDGNGGNDVADLGAGDDSFVWDPGDGSDTVEGGDGSDTMVFNGSGGSEHVTLSANGNRLRFFRDLGTITMDTHGVENVDFNAAGGADVTTVNDLSGTDVRNVQVDDGAGDGQIDRVVVNGTDDSERIDVGSDASGVAVSGLAARVAIQHQEPADRLDVDGAGGADSISATALAATAITATLDGGAGNDRIAGGPGIETLLGGDGNDAIDGNGGNDVADLGAGDDSFFWDPGDGSDTVEGGDGTDTMVFNGSGGSEHVTLSANGNRLRFFRDLGMITMDTHGVENVDFNAAGGADVTTVNDLSGTDVRNVQVDDGAGDGQIDRVVVNGTDGNDRISVGSDASGVKVTGLAATVEVVHAEPMNDRLEVDTLAGTDAVDSGGLVAGVIQLLVDGVVVP